jgi:hypothetical protein
VKHGQGAWAVTIDGEKLNGSASLQLDNGTPLTYSLEGTSKDGVFTVKLDKRSDDKKGCVWTGHARSATAEEGSRPASSATWFATAAPS